MPVRQKIFRIEVMPPGDTARSVAAGNPDSAAPDYHVLAELKVLRDLIEQRSHEKPLMRRIEPDRLTLGDLNKLKNETDSIHRAILRTKQELATLHFGAFNGGQEGRVRRELHAVVDGSERATQQILEAAEAIEDAANTLSASLKSRQEQALSSDIRDHVVRIFEACNFQDLSGQRIAKVLEALQFVEDRVARMTEIWGGREGVKDYAAAALTELENRAKLTSGPKLDGDPGHASQQEIDAMFA
jgi:chemotaxis protein CheZ